MTGSKADGVNFTETKPDALESVRGGEPVSIRKRGYHRALKSGKQWALSKKSWSDLLNKFCVDMYVPTMQAYILTENPFLKMQGLSQWLPNKSYNVKIKYGTPSLWSRIKSWFQI